MKLVTIFFSPLTITLLSLEVAQNFNPISESEPTFFVYGYESSNLLLEIYLHLTHEAKNLFIYIYLKSFEDRVSVKLYLRLETSFHRI